MVLNTEEEYEEAVSEMEDLLSQCPPEGSHEDDRLMELTAAIETYEGIRCPMD